MAGGATNRDVLAVEEQGCGAPFGGAVTAPDGCCSTCCAPELVEVDDFGAALYTAGEQAALPAEALAASLGCGNPLTVADLHAGERVLDLGSGGGIDVLLSAPPGRTLRLRLRRRHDR